MLFIKILRYILGFVRFRIYGEFPERLINQLGKNEIAIWNIEKKGEYIEADIFKKDYFNIRKLKLKNKSRTRVVKRYGLPFTMRRYKNRSGMAIGFFIFVVALGLFSNFIWNITVTGNTHIEEEKIIKALSKYGLYEGVKIDSVDTRKLPSKLMLEVEGIAWATINIEKTVANVEITETEKAEVETTEPSNLVASQDGTVTMLLITHGTKKVKVNQTVRKGDLLVSGIVEYKNGSFDFVRSAGEIIARTNEKIVVEIPYLQEYSIRTGRVVSRSVLSTPFFDLPLFLGNVNYQNEKVIKTTRISNDKYYIPFDLITADYYEIVKKRVEISEEQAEEKGMAELEYLETEQLKDANIISKKINVKSDDKKLILIAEYICEKNIAVEEKILFSTVN